MGLPKGPFRGVYVLGFVGILLVGSYFLETSASRRNDWR